MVTTRAGGRSAAPYDSFNLGDHVGDDPTAVAANRRRLGQGIGLGPERVAWMNQVHGTDVATVTSADGPTPTADALVTDRPRLALAVVVADCVPVLFADPTAGVVGAAHAGRRGAADGILARTLEAMTRARRRDRARRGPPRPRGLRPLLRGPGGDARRGGGRAARQRRHHADRHPGPRPARRAAPVSWPSWASPASTPTRAAPSRTTSCSATAARQPTTGRLAAVTWWEYPRPYRP